MSVRYSSLKKTVVSLIALSMAMPMGACDLTENQLKIDRSTNSEFQSFRDNMAARDASFADADASGAPDDVPELQAYVSDDSQSLKPMPLVSISVNQTIPLRDALFELAKQANFDVQLDPRITGSVIFTARNKPFDMVVDQICNIAGLRYRIEEDTLRIELDTPYSKNYKIDYIAFVRKNKSNITTDVGISGSANGSSAETGSGFQISSESEANFWGELDANLKQILASNAQGSYLKTTTDPQITLSTPGPNLPPAPPIDESALSDGIAPQAGGSSNYISAPVVIPTPGQATTTDGVTTVAPATAATPVADTNAQAAAAPQPVGDQPAVAPPQESVLRVESLPTSGDAASGQATDPNAVAFTPSYSINRQAGLVSVFANERVHKQIGEYLQELRKSSTSQVLIEAKVLEVQLSDEYTTGINWQSLGDSIDSLSPSTPGFGLSATIPDMVPTAGSNVFAASFTTGTFGALVEALSRFGTVHALASPRLTVINNQPAVLSVAKNTVYFELDVTQTTTGSPPVTDTTVDSEIKTVPEGVLINVLPSIDLERGQVSMQVRPTVTRIDSFKNDPGVSYLGTGLESPIPELNVQEIDSVVKLKSGQSMVMGGLLEDRSESEQNGIPVLSEAPVFGALFRNQSDKVRKTELVIFLKATILKDESETIHNTDRELYKAYSQDRRPTKM